ncbi:hypothetical protein ACFX13_039066 [Malus domestica]
MIALVNHPEEKTGITDSIEVWHPSYLIDLNVLVLVKNQDSPEDAGEQGLLVTQMEMGGGCLKTPIFLISCL